MTDRPDFESRLEGRLRARAALASRPFDAAAIAREAVAASGRRGRIGGLEWPSMRPAPVWLVVALLLAIAILGALAGVGALLRNTVPKLDLTPPADLPAFVLSTYDRMPQMPPVAITTLENGSIKGRLYVDRSGAVRIERFATPDAPEPDTYKILNGTTIGQLAIVGSAKVWVQQDGAISEDPRVFLLAEMEGGGAGSQPGCGVTRNQGEAGNGTAASGWAYVATEYVAGRPTFHVTCAGGDLWIDVETRLILRSRGPALDASYQPVPGSSRTIEVTELAFGNQPADIFEIAQPAGVARMSSEAYECQLIPSGCPTPEPAQPAYTPPPGAIKGPLPSLPPSSASNGWIAYSTDGQLPGGTDVTTGSDIYLVRAGVEPRLLAGREGGTTRNVCPAFSPDGRRLAFGVASTQARAVVVIQLDASGVIGDPVHINVPGPGPAVCPRWLSDGVRIAYLDGAVLVVRGLDGSTPAIAAGDPGLKDLERRRDPSDPLLSPSGDWLVRVSSSGSGCQMVITKPDGTAAHVIPLSFCPYAIAAWSPDGRQVILMEDVSGLDFTMHAIGVDSPSQVTVVFTVRTNGARSWPGRGDVSWQPVYP